LQLTNFWQDIRRDLLERDRVYLPADCGITPQQLRTWLHSPSDSFVRRRMQDELREVCRRTWALYREGARIESMVPARLAWILWLFRQGGERTLGLIETGGYVTLWSRPSLSTRSRVSLLVRAFIGIARGVRPPTSSE
jgi:phytoene/squalene synthetase